MGITDRIPHDGTRQPTDAAELNVPQPRSSPDTHRPARPPGRAQDLGSPLDRGVDFAHLYSRLRHVTVWTGPEGTTFLLRTVDGRWYAIERDSPHGTHLLLYLGQLPGFDTASLRHLTERPAQAPSMATLWPPDPNPVVHMS